MSFTQSNINVVEIVRGLGYGGAELSLVARLKSVPAEITTLVINTKGSLDVDLVVAEVRKWVPVRMFVGFFRYLKIGLFLHKNSIDALVVRTPIDAIIFATYKVLRLLNSRTLMFFEVHSSRISSNPALSKFMRIPLAFAARKIDVAICVSPDAAKGAQVVGIKQTKIIPFGTPIQVEVSHIKHIPEPRLLFVGRMVESKRPIWLLERIRNLAKKCDLPDHVVTFVGDGPLLKDLQQLTKDFRLDKKVRIIGFDNKVSSWLIQSNTLVICSTFEGLPLTFMEARLAGMRVISSPIFSDPTLFDATDFVSRSFDESEFEDLLERAIHGEQPSLQERLERRKRFEYFSYEPFAERYYKFMRDMVISHQKRRI